MSVPEIGDVRRMSTKYVDKTAFDEFKGPASPSLLSCSQSQIRTKMELAIDTPTEKKHTEESPAEEACPQETQPAESVAQGMDEAPEGTAADAEAKKSHHAKHGRPKHIKRDALRRRYIKRLVIGAIATVLLVAAVIITVNVAFITVTINGQQVQIGWTRAIGAAIEASESEPIAGDLLAVDGSVITEGGGHPFDAVVDGESVFDPDFPLTDGATITVLDGSDVEEDFVTTTEEIPFTASVNGVGAIHSLEGVGKSGSQEVRTGSVSGIRDVTILDEPVNIICTYQNSNVAEPKVVALTFDDGPNANYTPQILDILEANGAVATFFTLGSRINGDCVGIVQRAFDAGHQISTHSWDHADGSGNGVDLSLMTREEQIDEILKGYEAIESVTGTEANHIIRTPGGNFPPEVIANLSPYIASEIGWNIDTQDWQRPGVEAIKEQILSAKPGDIILMHDGGGDRTQTIEALAEALPILKEQGFQFVTIGQLLEMTAAQG